jgi:hypothetical protein
MKKFFKVLSLAVVFAVFFAACAEDQNNNDNNNNNNGKDFDIVGTYTFSVSTGSNTNVYTWVFAAEKTYEITRTIGSTKNNGSWSVSGNELTLKTDATALVQPITETFTVKESGDEVTLTLKGNSQVSNILVSFGAGSKGTSVTLTKKGESSGKPVLEKVLGSGTYGDFIYDYGATTIMIKGYKGYGGTVTIPSTIDGKPVVAIADLNYEGVFYEKNLTGVSIPDSVTYIGDRAFHGNQLTSVTIPNSVTYIDEWAFSWNQLASVTIPNSVTYIGEFAFFHNQLTSVSIGSGVTEIEDFAFSSNQLTSVTVASVNTAYTAKDYFLLSKDEKRLLLYFGSSKSVTIPNSVTEIGIRAFDDNQLTSVTIPNSVTTIRRYAFYSSPLTSITIGANVRLEGAENAIEKGSYDYLASSEDSFAGGFDYIYYKNGKLSGTYTRTNTSSSISDWTKVN